MKKCMICGRVEDADSKATCPACGEASWAPVQRLFDMEPKGPAELVAEVSAPVKRGPGRPRKS